MDLSVRGFEVAFRHVDGFVRLDPPQIRDVVQKLAESPPESCRGQHCLVNSVVVQKLAESPPESCWGQHCLVNSVVDAGAAGFLRIE